MNNKKAFLEELEVLLKLTIDCSEIFFEGFSKEAQTFYEELKKPKETKLTPKGTAILKFMQENAGRQFTAAQMGEEMGINPKSISGTMRSLLNEELVEKTGQNPVSYALTSAGREFSIDNK